MKFYVKNPSNAEVTWTNAKLKLKGLRYFTWNMTFAVSCKRDAKYFYCIQLKCGTKHLDPQLAHWLCKAWNRNLLYLVWTKTTLICSRAERRHSRRERQNSSGKSLGSKWKERYVDADSLLRDKPLLWRMIVTHSTETFRKHRHATKKIIWKLLKMGWL